MADCTGNLIGKTDSGNTTPELCLECGFMCFHNFPKNVPRHQCFCRLGRDSKQFKIAANWLKNPWNPPGACCALSYVLNVTLLAKSGMQ